MSEPVPRVTVFIPAYNAAAYIAEAIQSVLDQSFTDFELLIIDDGSTDDTLAVCKGFTGDARIRLMQMPCNSARPVIRNRGLQEARGEYIALLDADDRCLPGRLARQVAYLDRHPDIDVLATRWQGMDGQGRPVKANQNVGVLDPDTVTCYLLFRGIIHNPTVMARRTAMAAHAYDPAYEVAEDYDLWARMIGRHRFALLPDRLTAYRIYPEQASSAREQESREHRRAIQARELSRLGLSFTAEDIRRHNLLYTGNRLFKQVVGRRMDARDILWAGEWLNRIRRANARVQRFPEPAMTRLCARLLANVCHKAGTGAGGRVAAWYEIHRAGLLWPLIRARADDLGRSLRERLSRPP